MKLVRDRRPRSAEVADPYAGLVQVHASPCYDLLVSLRALYNPRTYERTRAWAKEVRAKLPAGHVERARFYFQGFDTALGYGAARLVPDLPADATPVDLIRQVRATDPSALALWMLDTGETTDEALESFRRHLEGRASAGEIDRALTGAAAEWARRCRRILADPVTIRSEFAGVLEEYHTSVFSAEVRMVTDAIAGAATTAHDLLAALPTVEAIDRLTGGYTLGDDLALRRITVAPSVFLYPFMSSRVEERNGEALIVFGVRTDAFVKYDPAPLDPDLLVRLKVLADPGRLKVMSLLSRGPLFGPELISKLGLSQPTVHHHLARLRAAGLIRQERAKGGMRYTVRREAADATITALRRLMLESD